MPFLQMIEFTTSRWDEILEVLTTYRKDTEGRRSAGRATICVDRDRRNGYVVIVEFASYEAAMENNNLEETGAMAEAMVALCDEPPTFRNLDMIGRFDD